MQTQTIHDLITTILSDSWKTNKLKHDFYHDASHRISPILTNYVDTQKVISIKQAIQDHGADSDLVFWLINPDTHKAEYCDQANPTLSQSLTSLLTSHDDYFRYNIIILKSEIPNLLVNTYKRDSNLANCPANHIELMQEYTKQRRLLEKEHPTQTLDYINNLKQVTQDTTKKTHDTKTKNINRTIGLVAGVLGLIITGSTGIAAIGGVLASIAPDIIQDVLEILNMTNTNTTPDQDNQDK